MEWIGVWSRDASLMGELYRLSGGGLPLLGGTEPGRFRESPLALLVVAPDPPNKAGMAPLSPRLALLPGEDIPLARRVRAQSAVSYGLGVRNTLTLSSLEPHRVCLALQRAVLTRSGKLIEPQEWVLPRRDAARDPEGFLCRMGARLLLDLPL